MLEKFCLPELGDFVKQGIILNWRKSVGEDIAVGEPLVDITADKATVELESPFAGKMLHIFAEPGDLVPSGGVLAVMGSDGDAVSEDLLHVKYPKAVFESCLLGRERMDDPVEQNDGEAVPLNAHRTVLAKRMCDSTRNAPHFFVTSEVDMSGCAELRMKLKKERKRVTYNDMILKACSIALKSFPQVAAGYAPGGYIPRERIDIGFAVSHDPDELYVPVVRGADELNLEEVAFKTKELIDKVKKRKLLPCDFSGGVFTVSNLGGFEVSVFSAIVNPGESAILAIGKIIDKPVVIKGEIAIRPMMSITLSSDHRVIDGVLAARFNGKVKSVLEDAEQLI